MRKMNWRHMYQDNNYKHTCRIRPEVKGICWRRALHEAVVEYAPASGNVFEWGPYPCTDLLKFVRKQKMPPKTGRWKDERERERERESSIKQKALQTPPKWNFSVELCHLNTLKWFPQVFMKWVRGGAT